jgi:hypothetical protein
MLAFSYEQTLVPTRPSFLSYDYQRPDATASGGFIIFLKVHKLWYVLEPVSRTERHGMVGRGKCQEKIDEQYRRQFLCRLDVY